MPETHTTKDLYKKTAASVKITEKNVITQNPKCTEYM